MTTQCLFYKAGLILDAFALLAAGLSYWYVRRRSAPLPLRSARMIVEIDGRTFIDIDSKVALSMIDCEYGAPVVNNYAVHGVQLRLTLIEGGTP